MIAQAVVDAVPALLIAAIAAIAGVASARRGRRRELTGPRLVVPANRRGAGRSNAAVMPSESSASATAARPTPLRSFGRFRLLRLLGKSERTMCWLVGDPRSERDLVLVLPRTQFADAAAAPRWAQGVRRAARLQHPRLAEAVEIGIQDNWPYVAYDAEGRATLADRIGRKGLPAAEAAAIALDLLEGLAYAHDAGVAHHDLQSHFVLVDDQSRAVLIGLEVAALVSGEAAALVGGAAGSLHAQRGVAEVDVLGCGLILHHALVGTPPLGLADLGAVVQRMPPSGPEIVRLPWSTGAAVPDVLRTIVNRASDRQERQRYRNARTLSHALQAWLNSERSGEDGPLASLLERIASVGVLPSQSGSSQRAARLASMDGQRTADLAAAVIDDIALAFELLRQVNSAHSRSAQAAGSASVLTIRRAIAMLGVDGLRRAATSLRPWPGALDEAQAAELAKLMARVRRAACVAVQLRPAGFDAEVVALLTMLQNLGRLLLHYHGADEALQIRRLMASAPSEKPGEPPHPGMSEESAAYSVIGLDIESLGLAVARRWGFDEDIVHALRRWPPQTPPHAPDNDSELLRLVASCANELLDLHLLPPPQQASGLQRIAQRYARVLHLQPKDLQTALQESASAKLGQALLSGNGNALYAAEPATVADETHAGGQR